jgi:putative peptidoglycan lipid II flippase
MTNTTDLEGRQPVGVIGRRELAGATGFLALAVFLSRVLGYVRDAIIGSKFASSTGLPDAYMRSFFVPDLLYQLLAGGALSSAFIPVFSNYLARGEEAEAWKVFSVVATVMLPVLTGFVLLCEALARPLAYLAAPGFPPDQLAVVTSLTRIVLPAQICFFLGGLLMGTQNARGHFFGQAIGPLIYNVGIIVGGLLLADSVGIAGFSWGALVGAIVGNLLLQMWLVRRLGVRYRPSLDIRHPGVVKIGKLLLPVMLGLSLPQLAAHINGIFATLIGKGPALWLNDANRLTQAPLGVFAQSAGIALLPTMAAQVAVKDMDGFRSSVSLGVRSIVALTLPTSVFMTVLAVPLIHVMYQMGEFTGHDTVMTAVALGFYCIGIAGWSAQAVIARAFYALHDTVTPVVVGTIMTVLLVPGNWVLMQAMRPIGWGHGGLALATSLAATLQSAVLLVLLKRRIGSIQGRLMAQSFAKVCAGCLALAMVSYAAYHVLGRAWHSGHRLEMLLQILVAMGLGFAAYAASVKALRLEEGGYVWSMFAGRLRRRRA